MLAIRMESSTEYHASSLLLQLQQSMRRKPCWLTQTQGSHCANTHSFSASLPPSSDFHNIAFSGIFPSRPPFPPLYNLILKKQQKGKQLQHNIFVLPGLRVKTSHMQQDTGIMPRTVEPRWVVVGCIKPLVWETLRSCTERLFQRRDDWTCKSP